MARIFKRGDTWYGDFFHNGKRKRPRLSTNRKQAELALAKILAAQATGEYQPGDERASGCPTFSDALDSYLKQREAQGKDSSSSYKALQGDWKKAFGKLPLSEITSREIEKRLNRWAKRRRWKPATFNNRLNQLSGFLKWCSKEPRRYIRDNPCRVIERLPVSNVRDRWLRPGEIRDLRDKAAELGHDWLVPIIEFAPLTGLRMRELCSATRDDVFEDGQGGTWLLVRKTKNREPLRWPLEGEAFAIVKRQLKKPKRFGKLLFPGPKGGDAERSLRRTLPDVVEAAGMTWGATKPDGVTFHCFRRSMATIARSAGVAPHVIQGMGNWKTPAMVQRYAKLVDAEMREGAAKLADVLWHKDGTTAISGGDESAESESI